MDKTGVTVCWVCETLSACVLPAGRWGWRRRWWWEARSPCGRTDRSCRPCRPERSARTDTETQLWSVSTNSCRDRQEKTISFIWSNVDILLQHIQPGFFFLFSKTLPALWGHNKQIYSPVLTFKYVAVKSKHSTQQKSFFEDKNCKGNKSYIKTRCTENESYLSLDAPRARTMGSAISSMDCRMEATTMKRMMERRKALWMTWSSMRPVWTARISRVMPSVIPLHRNEHARWLKLTTRHQQTPSTNPHTHPRWLTCALCCHSWRLCNLEGRTCRVWELPEQWRRRWKPDPAGSTVYYNILQYWGQEGREKKEKGGGELKMVTKQGT